MPAVTPGVPDWVPPWCAEHLGREPVEVLFATDQMSSVLGLRLDDGTGVVLKARPDDGRAASCVSAQAHLARQGFPCARPLTGAVPVGSLAVHAEELRAGGEILDGDSPAVAARYGEVFARLAAALAGVAVAPPLPNPRWVRWDHDDEGLWPAIGFLDERDQSAVPGFVVGTAQRVRARLLAAGLPRVLGHADFESQNLRWHDDRPWAVHDWDSLAFQPEPALVGAAGGQFPRRVGQPPGLASLESSEAFLAAYQQSRRRAFGADEREIFWAASLWPVAHNARWEALLGSTVPRSTDALRAQAAVRLDLANA